MAKKTQQSTPERVRAIARNVRMSPRKVRLVVDVVRGMNVDEALDQLRFINKKAAQPVFKVVESARANAVNNAQWKAADLYIAEITVNEGTTLKRFMPRAQGRTAPIMKRNSHIAVALGKRVVAKPARKPAKKAVATLKPEEKATPAPTVVAEKTEPKKEAKPKTESKK